MAPEQLEAREADARTDIFAFGCVVYEMITGRKAFEGKSQASVMAAILERQPPAMSSIQRVTSQHLEHLVGRCLVKDPDVRWQTARDLEEELRWVIERGDVGPDVSRRRPAVLLERLAWGLLVALVGLAAWTVRGGRDARVPMSEPRLMRFDIATPPTSDPLSFALSPDGRQLAYVASGDGVSQLLVRPLDQIRAQPLAGTAGASFPFWSPDSQSIGFFADGKLKRIQATGGPPRTLADATIGFARSGHCKRSPALFRLI
jgi:eukaryotic-like serine/threonine-protein kinase